MNLNLLWYGIITLLLGGFLFLEGADYGVGILLFVLGRRDAERQQAINAMGPFWDGNEVWLVAAGGAMFAAFPALYATVFSAFYIPLVVLLFGLILRGVAFAFRELESAKLWRAGWDVVMFLGSLLPAFLAGAVVGTLVQGLPLDASQTYQGTPLAIVNGLGLLGGVAFVLAFALHGALYLVTKADGLVMARAKRAVAWLWLPVALVLSAFLAWMNAVSPLVGSPIVGTVLAVVIVFGAVLLVRQRVRAGAARQAFWLMGAAIVVVAALILDGGLPTLVRSTLDPAGTLDVYNTASTIDTLRIMGYIAAGLLPLVILYQIWVHYLLRGRVSPGEESY